MTGTVQGKTLSHTVNRVLLDTGSVKTLLHTDIARYLGYDLSKSKRNPTLRLQTPAGAMEVPLVKVKNFTLLGMTLQEVEMGIVKFSPLASIDVLLGMDLLRSHCPKFTIDLEQQQFITH